MHTVRFLVVVLAALLYAVYFVTGYLLQYPGVLPGRVQLRRRMCQAWRIVKWPCAAALALTLLLGPFGWRSVVEVILLAAGWIIFRHAGDSVTPQRRG